MSFDTATNRINGVSYDNAGNSTSVDGHTYAYDAENRAKTIDGNPANYVYDAAGVRVKNGSTLYIFSGSKVIAEYASGALAKEYVYLGDKLIATWTGAIGSQVLTYQLADLLSTRVDDATATTTIKVGHLPFGDSWYGSSSKWKFTSYERDANTDTDYAMFRQHQWKYGRFMQAEPDTWKRPQSTAFQPLCIHTQ